MPRGVVLCASCTPFANAAYQTAILWAPPGARDARLRDASCGTGWAASGDGGRRGAFVRSWDDKPVRSWKPLRGHTPSENAPGSGTFSNYGYGPMGPVTGFDAFPSPTEMDAIEAIPGFSKSPFNYSSPWGDARHPGVHPMWPIPPDPYGPKENDPRMYDPAYQGAPLNRANSGTSQGRCCRVSQDGSLHRPEDSSLSLALRQETMQVSRASTLDFFLSGRTAGHDGHTGGDEPRWYAKRIRARRTRWSG